MNTDILHIQRIQSHDYWRGPVRIEPIAGGITNRNFLVEDGPQRFVVRLCEERPLLGIDRRNEVICHSLASEMSIAPELVHHEPGLLISRCVRGRSLSGLDFADGELVSRVGRMLRRLHDGWGRLTGHLLYFCPFQTIRTYARSAVQLRASLPDDIDALLDDSCQLATWIQPFRPVLCHNDMLPANVVVDGDRMWLVDWEYAGMGHPLFDLASVSANAGFTEAQDEVLLRAYRDQVEDREMFEIRLFKTASLLREALWAVIQTVASDIAFDYQAYAAENFRAYREARERIG